ncbi:hypothetical protein ACSW8Q_15890 (plasmid) [Clostridium perfringens]|uniref:Putative outer arm dynein beta heavy chain n=1 Tax=Clostridium perfringens E str. JGS1987 TaxID=451755 RepID=B1BVU0_CLOPF|nr:hypothetical protein [Clostridium perfringens]EDT14168.1 putative outer arm dynein beta heavy chain [Clostridium perfringens E str. JGS1987]ELC8333019.1 hypothetical protein [Clostridium perfringens]ELC8333350.1 hypothetical protein [Clostridium perfringens]ELC8464121.1 hypothetical protein [Clostridium perfringens]ELC8464315.1 hypothetical protein [Clostridium perfringens]
MNNLQNELLNSIRNLFTSNLSTKYISEEANIAYTTINELRNYKKSLNNVNFNTLNRLYNLAILENLNEEKVNRKKRNDLNDGIDFKIKIEEVIVAFNNLDLFAMGKLEIENINEIFNKNYLIMPLEKNTPKILIIDNSIFTTRYKSYSTRELGYEFNCNYCGNSPNTLVNFISEYSNIDKSLLEKTIFNKEIILYNFRKDEIKGYSSIFKDDDINIYYYNNKLIFKLNDFDNLNPKVTHLFEEEKKVILKDSSSQIFKILKTFKDVYKENINLKSIKIINDINADVNKIYKFKNNSISNEKDCYIILIYSNFEIWIPYYLYKSNKNNELLEFLNELGITIPNINDRKLNYEPYFEIIFNEV